MIYTITFIAILIIDHGIAKIIYMAACLPGGRVHKNCSIYTHNILVHLHHALPPMVLDILFQFAAPLSIIIYSSKSIINFRGRKNEAIFFTMGYDCLKTVIVCCHNGGKNKLNG